MTVTMTVTWRTSRSGRDGRTQRAALRASVSPRGGAALSPVCVSSGHRGEGPREGHLLRRGTEHPVRSSRGAALGQVARSNGRARSLGSRGKMHVKWAIKSSFNGGASSC